jgi:hypothetical protein
VNLAKTSGGRGRRELFQSPQGHDRLVFRTDLDVVLIRLDVTDVSEVDLRIPAGAATKIYGAVLMGSVDEG